MATKKKPKSKFADQAALESLVKFGPELSVLKEAQRTAQSTYKTRVAQAESGAQGVQQAVAAALPVLSQVYDQAGLDAARTSQTLIGHDLAGLGPIADSIKAGAALEAAGMVGRQTSARASAVRDFTDRGVQAAAGAVQAKRAAQDELVSNLAKILQSKQDLTGQKGAFEASTIGSLQDAQDTRDQQTALNSADNAQSERNSVRSAGLDPDTGDPIPNGPLDPASKKPSYASRDKHITWASDIGNIASFASRYAGKLTRPQIVEKLKKGRPQQTVYADAKTGLPVAQGTPGAVKQTLPKIPQFQADLRMTAALDVALDGHLSRATQKRLNNAGFKVKDLGLPTYAEWKKATAGKGVIIRRRPPTNVPSGPDPVSRRAGSY